MLIPNIFIQKLHARAGALEGKAARLTTEETNSNGNTGLKIEPEAVQMRKTAADLRQIADEVMGILAPKEKSK